MLTAGKNYEIIGKLIPGNKIIRDFDYKDPLIKTLRTYLYNPEKIHIDSSNVVPVRQKDRNRINSSCESSSYDNRNKNTLNSSSESSSDYEYIKYNKKL